MSNYLSYLAPTLLALVPAILWLCFWYRKDKLEPEPKRMIIQAFFLGVLALLPFLLLRDFWNYLQFPLAILVLLSALLEEAAKHFAVLLLGKRLKIEFNQIIDGVIYSVSVALGFAFAENVAYFLSTDLSWQLFLFRSLGTMLAHTLFSGLFGLFWGYAFLSMAITPHHKISVRNFFYKIGSTLRLHIIRCHILRGQVSAHGHEKAELVAEGLIVATLLHALFNFLTQIEFQGTSLVFLIVPLVMFLLLFLSRAFLQKYNLQIWKKAL